MSEGEIPAAAGDSGRQSVDIDGIVDKVVRRVYSDSIATKYVECPGCGNLIVRKYGECHKCRLGYNPVDNTWMVVDAIEPDAPAEAGNDRVGTII